MLQSNMKTYSMIFLLRILFWSNGFDDCKGMYMLISPDIPFLYLKYEAELNKHDDPFATYDVAQKVVLCDLYLKAVSFTLIEDISHLPSDYNRRLKIAFEPSNYQKNAYKHGFPDQIFKYGSKNMMILGVPKTVQMFLCSIYQEEVYITYGFTINQIFLIKRPSGADDSQLEFFAILESSVSLDTELSHNREALNNYFWYYIRAFKDKSTSDSSFPNGVPESMELCHLSPFNHFRLCSALAEQLPTLRVFRLDIWKNNYIVNPPGRCLPKIILDDNRMHMSHANVLFCAINQGWRDVQFYVLRDPNSNLSFSVFVLREVKDESFGDVLRVEGQMNFSRLLQE